MKLSPLLKWIVAVLSAAAFTAAPVAARPLAIGPSLVDAGDLTGDDAHMSGDVHSVWLGTRGVAVWATVAPGGVTRIMGAAFGADGKLTGGPPVVLVDGYAASISLSASGNEALLVWQIPATGVLARRLAPDLTWLDAAPAVLLTPWFLGTVPATRWVRAAGNAQGHGVLALDWGTTPPRLFFTKLGPAASPSSEVLTVDGPVGDAYIYDIAIAARPDGFLLAWAVRDNTANTSTVQARITGPAGTGRTVQTWVHGNIASPFTISAAPLGDGYAVAWTESRTRDVSGSWEFPRFWRRLDALGAPGATAQESFPLDANRLPDNTNTFFSTTLQEVNGGLLAISGESTPGFPYFRMIRRLFSADGTMGEVAPFGEVQAMLPGSTFIHNTGSGLLAVGEVLTSIYSNRASVAAAPVTAGYTWGQPSLLLSQGRPEQQACAVACRGTDYLVVWQDGRDGHALGAEIRGRFVALDGTAAGTSFRISNAAAGDISPAVAASGGRYIVAWTVNGGEVRAAFIDGPGTVTASFRVASPAHGVSVAGGPNGGFFAAWRAPSAGLDDIHGAWISGNGAVSPENGFPVGVSPSKERAVSVAGGAGTYGVVWRDGNSHTASAYGAVVPGNPVAAPVTPEKLVFAPDLSLAHSPQIAWNGSQYCAVWYSHGFDLLQSATLSESGMKGETITLPEFGSTPAIVRNGAGWEVFAYYGGVAFASVDAAGQLTKRGRFAERFADTDTLAAASAPDGGILIAYPTRIGGLESDDNGIVSGGIETVLLYPDRPAADPGLSVAVTGALTTLNWKVDPYFPRDANLIEASLDLQEWLRVKLEHQADGTGSGASITFPTAPGSRRYFRLNSSGPSSP